MQLRLPHLRQKLLRPLSSLRVLLLRVVAEHGVESSRIDSCGADVEDVLEDELGGPVDKPGTTIGT